MINGGGNGGNMNDWEEIDMIDMRLEARVRMTATPWMFFEVREPVDADQPVNDAMIKGYIKWDGCSEIDSFHACDRAEAVRIGVLMGRLYDIAAERMPERAGYLK